MFLMENRESNFRQEYLPIQKLNKKLSRLQYIFFKICEKPELKIYNSIEQIEDFGIVKPHYSRYIIALKEDKIDIEEVKLKEGGYYYFLLAEKVFQF